MAEPGRVYDDDSSGEAVTRPDLKALEGGGETSEPRRAHLQEAGSGFYNSDGDSDNLDDQELGSGGSASTRLKGAENASARQGLYNPAGAEGGLAKLGGRMKRLGGSKWLVGSLAGGSLGIIVIFILLVLLAGSL